MLTVGEMALNYMKASEDSKKTTAIPVAGVRESGSANSTTMFSHSSGFMRIE